MKLFTTAILALVAVQATAVDFDFRDFEGLWQSANVDIVTPATWQSEGSSGQTMLATIQCKATGDFRKAMCEFIGVAAESDVFCPTRGKNAKFDGKFILDQFDAETGKTPVMMLDIWCCDPQNSPECVPAVPSTLNYQLAMLPGKSNNHVRAIQGKFGAGTDSDPFAAFEADVQLRKTAGGFKSYD